MRDIIGLSGTKFDCGQALCGACTVHLDGVATRACVTPVESLGTSEIRTIETIDRTPTGRALQAAWLALDVLRCGYCQSGQIMAASPAGGEPHLSDADIDAAMSGNACRCGAYVRIREGIRQAAAQLTPEEG
nr:2Fe-2S iron-sulfur cluster-binding protein [Siccirubricoccus phaeus]